MGLSIAISGGIVIFSMIYLMVAFVSQGDEISKTTLASSDVAKIESTISQTKVNIDSIDNTTSNLVYFTVSNTGSTKLWNYDKFNVIVTYDGGTLSKIRYIEQLTFEKTCSSDTGKWCLGTFSNDVQDPGILNPGESVQIHCKLQNLLYPTNKLVQTLISTDNGVVASKAEVVP